MRADTLRSLLAEGLEEGLYPGAAFRIFHASEGVLAQGTVGYARENPHIPVSLRTVWDLASITKGVATATSILILAQRGAFHLDQEIRAFLPHPAPGLAGVTLRHCLTHVSGLRSWTRLHTQGWDREAIVRTVCAVERDRPPVTGYAYSDLGYILLGEAVEVVSGLSIAEFASREVFHPLRMHDTAFCPPRGWRENLAATWCPDRQRVLVGEVHDGNCAAMGGIAGHAGLFSSLDDLEAYGRMVLGDGESGNARILCRLAAREMARNQNPASLNGHTIGWFTRPNGYLPAGDFLPPDTFGHTGFTGTSLLFSPSLELGMILLTNRVHQQREVGPFLQFRRRFHNAVAGML